MGNGRVEGGGWLVLKVQALLSRFSQTQDVSHSVSLTLSLFSLLHFGPWSVYGDDGYNKMRNDSIQAKRETHTQMNVFICTYVQIHTKRNTMQQTKCFCSGGSFVLGVCVCVCTREHSLSGC